MTSSRRHVTSRDDINVAVVPSQCRVRSHSGVTPVACHVDDNDVTDEQVLQRLRPASTLLNVVRRDLRNDIRDISHFSTLLVNRMVCSDVRRSLGSAAVQPS